MVAEPSATRSDDSGAVSVADLCSRYQVDRAHADHVARLALRLFDELAAVHQLPRTRRSLLRAAALLHNVGIAVDPTRHHLAGRDILLGTTLQGYSQTQRDMIACCVRFHRKRVRPAEEPAFLALSQALQRETLILAALLRVADGLDYSGHQTSRLVAIERAENAIELVVEGPEAATDAARAMRKADLWQRVLGIPVRARASSSHEPARELEDRVPAATDTPPQATPAAEPDRLPPAPKRRWPELTPEMPVTIAIGEVLRFYGAAMRRHRAVVVERGEIEAIHDLRVATRRLRAALRLFRPYLPAKQYRRLRRGLRRTARALGAVRDIDVAMTKAEQYLARLPAEQRPDLSPLLTVWQKQRRKALKRLQARLTSARYRRLERSIARTARRLRAKATADVGSETTELVRDALPRWLGTARARVQVTAADLGSLEAIHALRIECKRLRYALECFQGLAGPAGHPVIGELVRVQDQLGELHDAVVAVGLLHGLLEQHDPAGVAEAWEGVRQYAAFRAAEREALLVAVEEVQARLTGALFTQRLDRLLAIAAPGTAGGLPLVPGYGQA